MVNVIRLGDTTSHGGKVIGCAEKNFKAAFKPMAVIGDSVSCPIQGHINCIITTGNARHRINGKAVAYDGDRTSCGAILHSTFPKFSVK